MNIKEPQNENYAAVVTRIKVVNKLDNCDNLVGIPLFGFQAIVSKNTQVGDIGIVFSAETQLSEEYAYNNNLFRHQELNSNPGSAGYLEDNRRVRCVRLRGNRSDSLFMPLSSLEYTGIDLSELKEGDVFDELNGYEICKKYEVYRKQSNSKEAIMDRAFKRVDTKFLPEHYSTAMYFRNSHLIKPNDTVYVTQKLHGTSIRLSNTIVKRKLNFAENLLKKIGVNIKETDFDYVFGSRRSIKDVNNVEQAHFYENDVWTTAGQKVQDSIPQNFILYGELIGYTSEFGGAIQKGYTYKIPKGTNELYIYRVAVITNQGVLIDLGWEQVKEFCSERGLKTVPELWTGKHKYLNVESYMDKAYAAEYKNAIPVEDGTVDEGICIRKDGLIPLILKAKSPVFYEHETKMLDEEAVDIEESQE